LISIYRDCRRRNEIFVRYAQKYAKLLFAAKIGTETSKEKKRSDYLMEICLLAGDFSQFPQVSKEQMTQITCDIAKTTNSVQMDF
jgi:hypothetical protein